MMFLSYTVPLISSSPADASVPINTDVNFFCSVSITSITEAVNISWTGPEIILLSQMSQYNSMDGTHVIGQLTVPVTGSTQEGSYFCTASYSMCTDSMSSDPAMLSIIPLPSVTIEPISVGVVIPPMDISFSCNARPEILSISWSGPRPDLQTEVDSSTEVTVSTLTLNIADVSYGGEYTCTATNAAGSNTSSVVLYVRPEVTPPVFPTSARDEVAFMCLVQNMPLGTIRWEKMDGSGAFVVVKGETDTSLTFIPVEFGDEGTYRCVVTTSEFGEQPSTTALITGMENKCLHINSVLFNVAISLIWLIFF